MVDVEADQVCERVAEGTDPQERQRERIKPSAAVVGRKREFLNPQGSTLSQTFIKDISCWGWFLFYWSKFKVSNWWSLFLKIK